MTTEYWFYLLSGLLTLNVLLLLWLLLRRADVSSQLAQFRLEQVQQQGGFFKRVCAVGNQHGPHVIALQVVQYAGV